MKPNRSENEILFDCEVDILNNKDTARIRIHDFYNDFIDTKGIEYHNNFSKDNWIGIFCWVKIFKDSYLEKKFPLWGVHMYNPFDAIFFLYAYFPILLPLRFIISLDCILAAYMTYKTNKNGKGIETSGKILSYFKCKALKMDWTFKIMTYLIEHTKEFNYSWDGVFDIYFKKDHRVNIAYHKNNYLGG